MSIHQQKMVRYSFDMPPAMHRNIKIACAEDGISMNTFVIQALEHWYSARTDRIDQEIIAQSEKEIAEHGTISLEEWEQQNV